MRVAALGVEVAQRQQEGPRPARVIPPQRPLTAAQVNLEQAVVGRGRLRGPGQGGAERLQRLLEQRIGRLIRRRVRLLQLFVPVPDEV